MTVLVKFWHLFVQKLKKNYPTGKFTCSPFKQWSRIYTDSDRETITIILVLLYSLFRHIFNQLTVTSYSYIAYTVTLFTTFFFNDSFFYSQNVRNFVFSVEWRSVYKRSVKKKERHRSYITKHWDMLVLLPFTPVFWHNLDKIMFFFIAFNA